MNRRNGILAYIIIWIITSIAILIIIWPMIKLANAEKDFSAKTFIYNLLNKDSNEMNNNKENYFYEKKIFIRHYKNNTIDDESLNQKPIIVIPPKGILNKVKEQEATKNNTQKIIPTKKPKVEGGFDIKPVPIH